MSDRINCFMHLSENACGYDFKKDSAIKEIHEYDNLSL